MKSSFAGVVVSVLLATSAMAHEIVWEAVRGRAVAVRISHEDGEALTDAAYEVVSPAGGDAHQRGRTDRDGWLSFVPNAPGAWRVRVLDVAGHGVDATVDVSSLELQAQPSAATHSEAALRLVVAAGGIVALFSGVAVYYRRKAKPGTGASRVS